MPDARRAPAAILVPTPRRVGRLGVGAAGLWLAAVAVTTARRVRRMRRSVPAHDLDHTATVGEGVGEPVRLLVLGDSAARGYGLADPADAFPQQLARQLAAGTGRRVHVTCLATDGHRTADVLDHQVPRLPASHVDAVVVSVGVNDAVGGTRPIELRRSTRDLLVGVGTAAAGAVTVVVTCPDLRSVPGLPWPVRPALGWRCRRVAAAQAEAADALGVTTVPLPTVDPAMYGADGFHPGAAGQAAMARVTVDALLAREADALVASDPAPPACAPPDSVPTDRGAPTWTST